MNENNLTFSQALQKLQSGNHLARSVWNSGQFVFLAVGVDFAVSADELGGFRYDSVLPALVMKTNKGRYIVGWQPNQEDLFTDDWRVCGECEACDVDQKI